LSAIAGSFVGRLIAAGTASAAEPIRIEGRIVAVADGDTPAPLDANKTQHKIRLDGIDAPEKAQAFGNRSKQSLSDLAFGRNAQAHCLKVDR
jgi:endonuclease YncB( thermonuclease family)